MTDLAAVPVLPGETLAGKYRIERVLGRGGMGVVLAARHLELDERVAIKFLVGSRRPDDHERFLREARAAAKIKSEHVCRVYDVARLATGEPYIVMEHLEGIDLGEVLTRERRLDARDVAGWVIEACMALAESHDRGIVHRDLKPSNLFLAKRGDGSSIVKVLDFGISKLSSSSDMTSTAVMMGSPLYMSPEQVASARDVDARSDVWSMGVVLFELLTGDTPFVGDSMIQLAFQVREGKPRSLLELAPHTPDGLVRIVERCLAKSPSERWSNAGELAEALAPYAAPDAAHLAERISRARAASNPALSATAPASPSDRDILVCAERTPNPPGAAPASSSPLANPPKRLDETLAPTHTTMNRERRPTRGRGVHAVIAALALVVAGLGIAVTRKHSPAASDAPRAVPTAETAAAATSTHSIASTTTPPEWLEAPRETIAPPPAPKTRARPTSEAVGRGARSKPSATSPAVSVVATSTAAERAPAPAAETAEAPAKKKRTLDRDDPY